MTDSRKRACCLLQFSDQQVNDHLSFPCPGSGIPQEKNLWAYRVWFLLYWVCLLWEEEDLYHAGAVGGPTHLQKASSQSSISWLPLVSLYIGYFPPGVIAILVVQLACEQKIQQEVQCEAHPTFLGRLKPLCSANMEKLLAFIGCFNSFARRRPARLGLKPGVMPDHPQANLFPINTLIVIQAQDDEGSPSGLWWVADSKSFYAGSVGRELSAPPQKKPGICWVCVPLRRKSPSGTCLYNSCIKLIKACCLSSD